MEHDDDDDMNDDGLRFFAGVFFGCIISGFLWLCIFLVIGF